MADQDKPLDKLLGKTIVGVVLSESVVRHPQTRLHLFFSDDSSYELWVDEGYLSAGGGLDSAGIDDVLEKLRACPLTSTRAVAIDPSRGVVQLNLLADDAQ